jgi:glycosyltransferase involved in cell wall biosynthesis
MPGVADRRDESLPSPPEVTVIIPTKDRWAILSRALRSALAQADVELEVVVVDDGSTDETPQYLADLRDPRVHVLRNNRGEGVARARNRGVAHAKAPWVAFLDDDDLWAPRKVRAELDLAASGADFVYTGMLMVGGDDGLRELPPVPADELRSRLLLENPVGSPSTVMVRTALVREVGGFDEDLSVLADWDLWIRLIAGAGAVPAACPELLVAYTVHAANMHRTNVDPTLADFRRLAVKHGQRGQPFGGSPFFRWVATSYRRAGRRIPASRTYLEAAVRYRTAGDLMRALAVLLGERAMTLRSRPSAAPVTPPEPAWLAQFAGD